MTPIAPDCAAEAATSLTSSGWRLETSDASLSSEASAAKGLVLDEDGVWLERQRFADDMRHTKGWMRGRGWGQNRTDEK
jgi:hypothetical protein